MSGSLGAAFGALASNEYDDLLIDVQLLSAADQKIVRDIAEPYAATVRIRIQSEAEEQEDRRAA